MNGGLEEFADFLFREPSEVFRSGDAAQKKIKKQGSRHNRERQKKKRFF